MQNTKRIKLQTNILRHYFTRGLTFLIESVLGLHFFKPPNWENCILSKDKPAFFFKNGKHLKGNSFQETLGRKPVHENLLRCFLHPIVFLLKHV